MASKWTNFTDDVEAESDGRHHKLCGMCSLLENLPAGARENLQQVLDRSDLSAPAIRRALSKRLDSTPPSDFVIRRHRRGECHG